MRTCYSPNVLIRHAYNRAAGESTRVRDNYLKGRGAFYCKHLLRGDRVILRHTYYEVAGLLKATFAHQPEARVEYPAGRALRNLAVGAFYEISGRS